MVLLDYCDDRSDTRDTILALTSEPADPPINFIKYYKACAYEILPRELLKNFANRPGILASSKFEGHPPLNSKLPLRIVRR